MLIELLQLLLGLAMVIKGGDLFVAASVRIAEFLKMPRVVIGSTLVSLATTTPELVVSVISGLKNESGLAVGNAVGSCICNIALILGLAATIKHVDIHPGSLRTPLVAMIVAGAVLFAMTLDLRLSRWQGCALVLLGLMYFVRDFIKHFRVRQPALVAEATAIEREMASTRLVWFRTRAGTVVQFLTGAAIVVAGSRFLVEGAVGIANQLGISPIIVGLTVVSLGTSLPELVTAVTSSRKSVADLAVGNVLGANIANLTLVVGAAAMIHEVSLDRLTQLFNFPAMLIIMGLVVWMLFSDSRLSRREGAVLLTLYGVYIIALILQTALVG